MGFIPQFAKGQSTKIQPAIDAGIITYPAYVYETDTNKFAFVNADLSVNHIVGDNVIQVDKLPSPDKANKSCLYVMDNILYTFDGDAFHPQSNSITDEMFQQLTKKIEDLEDKLDEQIFDDVQELQDNIEIIKAILGDDLFSQAISLDDYIKEIVNYTENTLVWGEF